MAEPVTLTELKAHLRLELGDVEQDEGLARLIQSARRAVENRIDRRVAGELADVDEEDLVVVSRAMLLLAGHWYANREAAITGTIATEMPMAVEFLIAPLARLRV